MAKKKQRNNTNDKPAKGAKQQQAGAAPPGGRSAFALGCLGVLVVVGCFLPWFAAETKVFTGFGLITGFDEVPKALSSNLASVGGPLFLGLVALLGLVQAGLGFGWERVYPKLGDHAADLHMVLGVAALVSGLLLMLCLLNMDVRSQLQFPAQATYSMLLLMGAAEVVHLMVLDKAAGRTATLLDWPVWGVWLGGLLATLIVHYVVVCYKLVLKAPEFLSFGARRIR